MKGIKVGFMVVAALFLFASAGFAQNNIDGKIGYEVLKALVGSLSPNLMAQIERIEKDRG